MAGIGGESLFAYICQNLIIGGGIGYSLVPGGVSQCPGGEVYLEVQYNASSMLYEVEAGTVLTANFDGPPVTIESTSVGSVTEDMYTMRDQVIDLPESTDVTLTTHDRTVTLAFSGSDVTIKAFDSV
jgi:hypothetical protein